MRGFAIAVSLAVVMSAGAVFAQTPPARQPPPAQPAPARPAQPAPAPAAPAVAQPPVPFPAGAKMAYINPQRIFQESAEGKTALTRVQTLINRKQTEGQDHLSSKALHILVKSAVCSMADSHPIRARQSQCWELPATLKN